MSNTEEKPESKDLNKILQQKEEEIKKLRVLLKHNEHERTRERKYSLGFISQMFRTYWGYDEEFNSQMSGLFNKINTEMPINEQMDTVFELQSTLQIQAKKMKLFHGTISAELDRLKQAIEHFPVLLGKLSRGGIAMENFHDGSNIDRIMSALSVSTAAITYLEESYSSHGDSQIPDKYKNELAGVISSLNPPSQEAKEEVKNCLELIKNGASYADLAILSISLLRNISRAFNKERDSSLNFLEEFYENINQIQNSISENISQEHVVTKQSLENNDTLRTELSSLNDTLDGNNFSEMSCIIKEKLEHLAEIVREHSKYISMQDRLLSDLSDIENKISSIRSNAANFREELQDVARKSRTDPLTGLYNRLSFDSVMEKELSVFQKNAANGVVVPFHLLLIDVNSLGAINQKYGTNVGDKILRVVAITLRQNLRNGDFLARLNADRYALIIHDTQPENIHRVASKLITAVKGIPFHYSTEKVCVSITVAARMVTENTASPQALLDVLTDDIVALRKNPDNPHFSIAR